MTLTLENQNAIRNILGNIETPFDTNQVYTCRVGSCQKIAFVSDSGINAKGKRENLVKLEISVVRVGIKYANLKQNIGKEIGALPYGEMVDKYYIKSNDKLQLRVYKATLPNAKTKVYYLLNGELKTKEWLVENNYFQDSYLRQAQNEKLCFNIKVENIIKFGKGE